MDIRNKIREVLSNAYGNFDTPLEQIYEERITGELLRGTNKDRYSWVTYNQVILELKHSLKDQLRVKELQYKLTDKNDPADVCIEVLNKIKQLSPELERLYYKIKNF